jgi:hypothetical protein
LPKRFMGGSFIGQHGSWNRQPRSGYKVIFVPFADGHPAGTPEDILTGFVSAQGDALGRPVGVAVDRAGALLVADDVGNSVWRVTPRYGEIGAVYNFSYFKKGCLLFFSRTQVTLVCDNAQTPAVKCRMIFLIQNRIKRVAI